MIGRITCIVLVVLNSFTGYSQTGTWWKNGSIPPKKQIQLADSLMLSYRRTNPDSAIFYARLLIYAAKKYGDTGSVDFGTIHLGSLHRIKGNLDSAIYYYTKVLQSYKKQRFYEGIASVYNNLATVYKTRSRYDLAIKNYLEAVDLLKNSKRFNALANLYSNFAGLYFKLENYSKALELWQMARKYYTMEKKGIHELSHAWRGIGRVYIKQGKTDHALAAIQTALDLDRKNNIQLFISEDLMLLMEIHSTTANLAEIARIQLELKPYIKKMDVPLVRAGYYEYSGDFEQLKKNHKAAIAFYDSSLLNTDDVPEIKLRVLRKKMEARLGSSKIQNLQREWTDIQELEKTVSRLRQDRITQETDARYNLRDKEELIVALNERNNVINQVVRKERELKEQSRRQNIYLWAGILVACLFAVYVLFTNRKLNLTKKELEKNIEQKDFLFKELNHRVKNNLHIVSSFLGIEMHGKPEDVQDILRTCENRIHSLGLVHEMLYRSEKIETVELQPYFDKLCHSVLQTLGKKNSMIETRVQPNIWVSSEKAILIGLIVNELLTNAIKYANPQNNDLLVQVTAFAADNLVTIQVNDNGTGIKDDFDPQKSKSMGMKLAYGLADQLDGQLSWKNTNPGTSFDLSLQLPNSKQANYLL